MYSEERFLEVVSDFSEATNPIKVNFYPILLLINAASVIFIQVIIFSTMQYTTCALLNAKSNGSENVIINFAKIITYELKQCQHFEIVTLLKNTCCTGFSWLMCNCMNGSGNV